MPEKIGKKHIGEKRMMKCGMEAEIIAYRSYKDIDIRFTDGTVREHILYDNFKKCKISNPNLESSRLKANKGYRSARLGEKRMMKCGMEAEIIAYRNASDIDVRFTDSGIVRVHRGYRDFVKGGILPSKNYESLRVGETKTMHDGSTATITAYRGFRDIDVAFGSGETKPHISYRMFSEGRLHDPGIARQKKNHIGEKLRQRCGLVAEIISQNKSGIVGVRFQDGSERKKVKYGDFKKGNVGKTERKLTERVGEKRMMACGLEAKITAYRNSLDIDVRLGNNELLKHKKYKEFLDGALHPGTITRHEPKVGDTVMANNGQMMTLTAYITSKDVDVTFEDGTLVTNKSLYSFLSGSIENPNAPYGKQKWRIGMIGIANNGLRMKITKRVNKETLHIQFESGHERDILVNNFRLGRANVLDENGKMLLSRSPNAKGEFLGYLTQYAYDEGNKIWYKAIDTYTGEHMLLTPQMMMANRRVSPAF